MAELERALHSLVEHPGRLPDPIEELERRVFVRQRRRARRRAAAVVVVLAVLGGLPVLASLRGGDTVVDTGPIQQPAGPTTTAVPGPSRVQAIVPSGWERLYAQGDRLVLATRPLSERDLRLALLARDDAAFGAFPPDAVVFVVGNDRLTAKYISGEVARYRSEHGESIATAIVSGPGPANGLGEEKTLPGGVLVRRGDVPESGVLLAAYLGPRAPAARSAEAETIAASVRVENPAQPSLPPPPGSRPGFDAGGVTVPAERMKPVATADLKGVEFGMFAAEGCAVVRTSPAQPPLAGGCTERPLAGEGVKVVASALARNPPIVPPGVGPTGVPAVGAPDPAMVVVARAAADVRTVRAVLVDGQKVDGSLGADGWALVATAGRTYLLEAYDARGRLLAEAVVT